MYPQSELRRLALHKAALCRNLAVERTSCAEALTRVLQPLAWLDRMLLLWRRLSPLLRCVPLGLLVMRATLPRWKILRSLVAWSPLAFDVARALRSATRPSARTSRPAGTLARNRR